MNHIDHTRHIRVRSTVGLIVAAPLSAALALTPITHDDVLLGSPVIHSLAVITATMMLAVMAVLSDLRDGSMLDEVLSGSIEQSS